MRNGLSGHEPQLSYPPTPCMRQSRQDRKSTRLNSSHANISYAVFCLKKKRHPTTRPIFCIYQPTFTLSRHASVGLPILLSLPPSARRRSPYYIPPSSPPLSPIRLLPS